MAKKQRRPCFLISFSVRSKSIDLANPRNWGKLDNFLKNSFSVGTDGEQMLAEAIKVLQTGTFEMADVLIISDFKFPIPLKQTQSKIEQNRVLGTRFYGLKIGRSSDRYDKILDKLWVI